MKNHKTILAGVLLLLLAGGSAGYALRGCTIRKNAEVAGVSERREGGYVFINPLLECDTSQDFFKNSELRNFKASVDNSIRNAVDQGKARKISVYFRELQDGLWFSIGGMESFTAASMLKVPLMIAYFKEAERDPGLLARRLKFAGINDNNPHQSIKPSQVLVPDHEYTVEELIRRMIVYSDNNAALLLRKNVKPHVLFRLYQDLGIEDTDIEAGENNLSIITFTTFLRVLYNSSYLTREMSEKSLRYLSQAEFRKGLVAGVPPAIPVAHKFGERFYRDESVLQLHDCGIVYYPRHPYMLCVMTRGDNLVNLEEAIAAISYSVFVHVNDQQLIHP